MDKLYYVTSVAVKGDQAFQLRWFVEPESLYNSGPLEDPLGYGNIDELMSLDRACGLAEYLKNAGHEEIAIQEVTLPITDTALTALLLMDGNLWPDAIEDANGVVCWAYTTDNIT
jgi:hypothetical protein